MLTALAAALLRRIGGGSAAPWIRLRLGRAAWRRLAAGSSALQLSEDPANEQPQWQWRWRRSGGRHGKSTRAAHTPAFAARRTAACCTCGGCSLLRRRDSLNFESVISIRKDQGSVRAVDLRINITTAQRGSQRTDKRTPANTLHSLDGARVAHRTLAGMRGGRRRAACTGQPWCGQTRAVTAPGRHADQTRRCNVALLSLFLLGITLLAELWLLSSFFRSFSFFFFACGRKGRL